MQTTAWEEELNPGQRSPDWLETLNAGTPPESPWQWSQEDVVFSAAYHDATVYAGGQQRFMDSSSSSSSSSNAAGNSSSSSPLSSTTNLTTPASSGELSPVSQSASTMQALLVRSFRQGWDRAFELHHAWPRPTVRKATEVLIRNKCIGLNPVDFKSILFRFGISSFPWVLGRDVAGIIEDVGADVHDLKAGDRVWTCADSRDVRCGAYQEWSIAEAATVGKIPDNMSDDQAATLGTGLVTAAIALYWLFKLPLPSESRAPGSGTDSSLDPDDWVLIYGGGAITGIFAAQLASLSGTKVLAVASPSNFTHLQTSCGIAVCVDRFLPPAEIEAQILERIGKSGRIRFALDCVGSKTAGVCANVLRRSRRGWLGECHFVGLAGNPKEVPPEDAKLIIHRISFSTTFYGSAPWSRRILAELTTLLATRQLHPVHPLPIPDGLAGVRKGLEMLKDGVAPSALKLVARIEDTPAADLTNLGVRCELGWNGA